MTDALSTLFFPFERGLIEAPGPGQRAILFGAPAGLQLPSDFAAEMVVVQDFRPDFLALERSGFSVTPYAEGEGYDAALLLLGRHRRESEARIAEALHRVRPGGLVLASGTKKEGAPSMAKRLAQRLPLEDQISKYHGTAFWLRRPKTLGEDVLAGLSAPLPTTPERYETACGGFSEGSVDAGSRLLCDSLPPDISGAVADFAAGWGYLSLRLAARYPLSTLDLYEAHRPSLDAAQRNLAAHAPAKNCRFFWHDLLGEPVPHRYDAIVMNPPFHRSRAAEPDIGAAMVNVAAKALRPGGRLFLVANRGLPYEASMAAAFSRHGETCRDRSYKILWGVR